MSRQDAIERGVALLDREQPDWLERISLKELDLMDPNSCVLGEAYQYATSSTTGFHFALSRLFKGKSFEDQLDAAERHGFVLLGGRGTYEGLTKAWKRTIRRLRRERGQR